MRCQVCSAEYGTSLLKCSCRRETRKMSKRSLGEMCGSIRKLCKQAHVSRFTAVLRTACWCCHIEAPAFHSRADLELTALSMWQSRNHHNIWVRSTEFPPWRFWISSTKSEKKVLTSWGIWWGKCVRVCRTCMADIWQWRVQDNKGNEQFYSISEPHFQTRLFTCSESRGEEKTPTKQEQIVQSISGDA